MQVDKELSLRNALFTHAIAKTKCMYQNMPRSEQVDLAAKIADRLFKMKYGKVNQ